MPSVRQSLFPLQEEASKDLQSFAGQTKAELDAIWKYLDVYLALAWPIELGKKDSLPAP